MKNLSRKEFKEILLITLPLLIIPSTFVLMHAHPLTASSSPELARQFRETRQDQILDEMLQRYEAVSLNFDGPDTGTDPIARWQQIETTLQETGTDPAKAHGIIQIAQDNLPGQWPCLAEQGYLDEQLVWMIAASSPHDTGFISWICPPSKADIRAEQTQKYCTDVKVTIISADVPLRTLNEPSVK